MFTLEHIRPFRPRYATIPEMLAAQFDCDPQEWELEFEEPNNQLWRNKKQNIAVAVVFAADKRSGEAFIVGQEVGHG